MGYFYKKILLFSISIIASLILGLILLEKVLTRDNYQKYQSPWSFVIEAGRSQRTTRFFILDKTKIYALRKAVWISPDEATDENSFRFVHRSGEINISDRPYSIVAVGDSFTYGFGVNSEESYPATLERLIRQSGQTTIVHNAGVSGYGIDQEYIYIQQIIRNLRPNMIIWNINMNDFFDSNESCLFLKLGNRLVQLPGWLNTLYVQGYLTQHLPIQLLGYNVTNFLLYLPNRIFGLARMTPICTGLLSAKGIQEKTIRLVNEANKFAREHGVTLVTTLVPYQWFFNKSAYNDHEEILFYKDISKALASAEPHFIDVNIEIARLYDQSLLAMREQSSNKMESFDVLGQSTESLATLLFRSNEDFTFGWRHPNALGHNLFARTIYTDLSLYLGNQEGWRR